MAHAANRSTALWVLRRLRQAGHQALFAGGCVRDMLLGRASSDYDVATDATPQEVRRLFRRVLLIGAKFGVAMVLRRGRRIEVATFRSDLSYSDGRRPDAVRFSSPRQDALRRDFTINGMFYDPIAGEVIDHVGGRGDLEARVIRTIGRADERFAEDYLRMLRAVRFAVRFAFAIAPGTAGAIRRHAAKITGISGERVFEELSRMLSARSAAAALRLMREVDLARHLLPELFAAEGLWPAAQRRVAAVAKRKDLALALGALLSDLPAGQIRRIVRRWGASNDLRDSLAWLAEHAEDWRAAGEMPLAAFRKLAGHEQFPRLRALWGVRERLATGGRRAERRAARRLKTIPAGEALPPPFLNGEDLLAMGVPEGPRLGRMLRELYDAQLNLEVRSRKAAVAWAAARIAGDRAAKGP